MKSKKVLIGLILAAFVGTAGISVAQTKANYQNNLIEIGPDNVAGRVRAVVADQSDPQHKTLYAGGVAGGLYRLDSNATNWEFVPYMVNNKQVTLPISYLHQTAHDNMIYIATGEGMMVGERANEAAIVPQGKGILQYNPADNQFSVLPGSTSLTYINKLSSLHRDGTLYLYAATNSGLYRWVKTDNGAWGNPQTLYTSGAVQDVEVVSGDNMAFFTSGAKLFKITSVTSTTNTVVDITSSCSDFGGDNLRIEIAAAKADKTYLYALVTDNSGLLKGVYLTTNQSNWTKLTTSTIAPFSTASDGWNASSLTIDPTNYKRIFIGGETIWMGQGYIEGSFYQWTQMTYSEDLLNGGSYMEQVIASPAFVHSGIHQILPVPQITEGDTTWVYYMSTDGGIFKTIDGFNTFVTINKGFNTLQVNGLAIAPDGSILTGAIDNACPFIQSRNAHNGGSNNDTWYDNTTSMNHNANILWFGDGGQVEASMFQQLTPLSRRGLFFSSNGQTLSGLDQMGSPMYAANYGRSYADYFDYTNTQTWTTWHEFFTPNDMSTTNPVSQMCLFETINNKANDSITVTLDTLGNFIHNGALVSFQDREALGTSAGDYVLKSGDKLILPSKAHFNYPFEYNVTSNMKVKDNMTLTVHNPIASRLFFCGYRGMKLGTVIMTTMGSDYSRVNGTDKEMRWACVYKSLMSQKEQTGTMATSTDGDALFVSLADSNGQNQYVLRIHNLNGVDYNSNNFSLQFEGSGRVTIYDTIYFNASTYRFSRPITALSCMKRNGHDDLLIAFGGEDDGSANVILVENVCNKAARSVKTARVANGAPAYSCLIECTTGTLYVGTAEGVFTSTSATGTWSAYGDFDGVPVTAMRQQTKALPKASYLGHTGISEEHYLFAKTKYPNALYFGTYGRGIFMDMKYVTDTLNEVSDSTDWVGIQTVNNGLNSIQVYPNPASDYATIDIAVAQEGNAVIRVYDLSGKLVFTENLGRVSEGQYTYRLNCQNFRHGMYLINMNIGSKSATSKLVVK